MLAPSRKLRRLSLALALALTGVATAAEFRALWVSRFEWPVADPVAGRAKIDQIFDDMAAANFNAVFWQIRGQADVLYPSPEEVWSPLIGGSDPGWDPLAYAISAAHARGIEFHAYINIHTCWQSVPASAHTLPPDPNHIFYQHCNAADPAHRDWLHYDAASSPSQFNESDYVWFAPGVPAYQAYIRRQVLYVVQNYDVDGVHYDRIRTPASNEPSQDPIGLARWSDPQSNPANLSLQAWNADQITRTVRDIYAAISAVKPQIKVSAAVFPNPGSAPTAQNQEALRWAQTGGLDIIVPMMYFTGGAGTTWDNYLQQWLAGAAGRHVVAGQITTEGQTALLDQVTLSRTRGAQGNSVFSWSSFTFWSSYLAGPYAAPTTVPALAWKDNPTTAIIYGYVTDPGGAGVVDAHLTRSGSSYVGLSSGDGFYSLLLVPPGTYTLAASHPAYSAANAQVTVAAGDIVRQDLTLGPPLPPVIAEVQPDPDVAVAGQPYQRQLTLASGVATQWTLLSGPAGAGVNANGLISGWTPSMADIGHAFAFNVRASNATGSDDEAWTVSVAAPPPCSPLHLTSFDDAELDTRILFNLPRYSGTTSNDLATAPNEAVITDAVGGFSGTQCMRVAWQFVDTDPQRWMRLTTFNAPTLPNPTLFLDRPVRVRLRLDSGRLRVSLGIRETVTTAELGANGGTSGSIEWVGAAADIDGAPQGVLVEGQPGVWQTLVFDPLVDPVHAFTGDGVLSTASGLGVFEHLAFAVVDGAGPFDLYIDDIDFLCPRPPFGDVNHDGELTVEDLVGVDACLAGPGVTALGGCGALDADADLDVDLGDLALIQAWFR